MSTFVRPRNETHLDALGVTMVKLPSPPHLVETSPDGSLLVAATPHGATFYWPPNVNNADGSAAAPANAVHSVALNERISALAFLPQGARQGAAEGALRLYVATPQSVCVWDISTIPLSQTQQSRRDDRDLGPRTVIFRIADGEEEGGADPVGFQQRAARETLAVSDDGSYLAIGLGHDVIVMETATHQPTCRLEGHASVINAMAFFHPHRSHALVTVSDDRTFKVWDCDEQALLYQSGVVASAPLLSVAVDPNMPCFALGASDGSLRVYRYEESRHSGASGPLVLSHSNAGDNAGKRRNDAAEERVLVQCTEAHYDNLGRMLDRRDAIRQGNASVDGAAPPTTPAVPVVSSLPAWARVDQERGNEAEEPLVPTADVAPSRAIVMLAYRTAAYYDPQKAPSAGPRWRGDGGGSSSEDEGAGNNDENRIRGSACPSYLVVATPKALVHVNSHTYMVDAVLEFDHADDIPPRGAGGGAAMPLSPLAARALKAATASHPAANALPSIQAACASMFETPSSPFLNVFVGNEFKSSSAIVRLPSSKAFLKKHAPKPQRVGRRRRRGDAPPAEGGESAWATVAHAPSSLAAAPSVVQAPVQMSVFPSRPLHDASPLVAGYAKTLNHGGGNVAKRGSRRKGKDKPVTFHTRIRSSGYGKAPAHTKLFGGKGGRRGQAPRRKRLDLANSAGEQVQYPTVEELSFGAATPCSARLANGPITGMCFARDAKVIGVCGADGSATSSRLPVSRDKKKAQYMGHEGPVTAIDWNHGQQLQLLLTSSDDGKARVWKRNRPAAVLELVPGPPGSAGAASAPGAVPAKGKSTTLRPAIKASKFFYVDKFILMAVANRLELHKYAVDHLTDEKNDLRRLQNHSRHRLVKSWEQPSQTINSIACVNSFFSHTVITAGSNRGIQVYDLGVGQLATSIDQAHARAVHSVVLPTVSEYTSLPNNVYDVFATGSTDGSAKVWDLREGKCVRRFQDHANRVQTVGMAFSPCMRYFACGSENKTCLVYDLRNGQVLDKLRGHTDTVTSVAFNPRYPQLATGGGDGKVMFYNL